MIALQTDRHKSKEKHLSGFDMINLLSDLKKAKDTCWLKDISKASLCSMCIRLAHSYDRFFNKISNAPKMKSKKIAKKSFPVRCEKGTLYFTEDKVQVQKIGKIKYKSDILLPNGRDHKFGDASILVDNGKYYLSFVVECETQAQALNDEYMGIDLGIKHLAVIAYGSRKFVYENINKSARVRNINKKLKHTKRSISRKYEYSKKRTGKYTKTHNIIREEEKMRRLYARLYGIRHNYLHQTTHSIVSMLPSKVTMEKLDVCDLLKNKKNKNLRASILGQCFSEFTNQMKYKCEYYGIEFVQADRFYPSSKTCSECGCIKRDLKLSDRVFICPDCGLRIDRDYNAAINLMRYEA